MKDDTAASCLGFPTPSWVPESPAAQNHQVQTDNFKRKTTRKLVLSGEGIGKGEAQWGLGREIIFCGQIRPQLLHHPGPSRPTHPNLMRQAWWLFSCSAPPTLLSHRNAGADTLPDPHSMMFPLGVPHLMPHFSQAIFD